MLKKLALLTIVLLVGAMSATAQTPCQKANDLSWLFAPPPEPSASPQADDGLAWLLEQQPVPAVNTDPAASSTIELAANRRSKPGVTPKTVTCSEDCNELPDISCTGNACSAQSRDCGNGSCIRGSVTCDGVTTYCSQVCPTQCTLFQCRQGCKQSGCVSVCIDQCTCECETICQ
jgi:hypothetical protein